jgi:GT2 family glycosyltransferase
VLLNTRRDRADPDRAGRVSLVRPSMPKRGDGSPGVDVLVLIACFNRRDITMAALRNLGEQRSLRALDVAIVLYDAGSDDGTAGAVKAEFPVVEVIRGRASAYWSRSMEIAQRHALAACLPRYLLWLNDDAVLDDDALNRAVDIAEALDDQCVVMGALRDPRSGSTTYTGMRRTGRHPLRLERVEPTDRIQTVDTFNGNFVLVPQSVYLTVGTIDGRFEHAYGDLDYGFRVSRAGLRGVLAPGHFGACARNLVVGTWRDAAVPRSVRLRLLLTPKAMPIRPYLRFLRRHGPVTWPAQALVGYLKVALLIARRKQLGGWKPTTGIDATTLATPVETTSGASSV